MSSYHSIVPWRDAYTVCIKHQPWCSIGSAKVNPSWIHTVEEVEGLLSQYEFGDKESLLIHAINDTALWSKAKLL